MLYNIVHDLHICAHLSNLQLIFGYVYPTEVDKLQQFAEQCTHTLGLEPGVNKPTDQHLVLVVSSALTLLSRHRKSIRPVKIE